MKTNTSKLRGFLKQITPIAETYGKKKTLVDLEESITKTEESTSVLFCGEFKRGKSSLVNAIIGTDLCPTDVGIATSVVTIIRYGAVKKAVRFYGNLLEDTNALRKEEIEWSDIKKFTMGDLLEIDNTILVELQYPSPFLKDGITIIDTPGIGGLDPRHAVLTQMALPKADIIVFVTDAAEPLTQSELNFYRDKISSCGKQNIVLVNKSDLLTSDVLANHINNTKLQLAQVDTPQIVSVSAMNWSLFSQLQDKEFLLASNRDEVLASITSAVKQSRDNKLKSIKDCLIANIENISNVIAAEKKKIAEDSEEKQKTINDLQQKQVELNKFRNDLTNPMSPIRLQINSVFENARNEVQNIISHEGTILTSTEFDALLDSEKGLDNDGKWFIAQINDRLSELNDTIDNKINDAFEEISKSIQNEINYVLNSDCFLISNDINPCNVINSQLVFSLVGKAMPGMMIGVGTAAAVSLLIPGVALVAGVATAAALIWKQISRETRQQKRNSIRQQVLPKINLAITDMRNLANTRFTQFHQNILQELQNMTNETEEQIKVIQSSIMVSRGGEKESNDKILALEQKEKFLQTLKSQLMVLYSNPFANAK